MLNVLVITAGVPAGLLKIILVPNVVLQDGNLVIDVLVMAPSFVNNASEAVL
jgi:ribosomal protein L18E